MSLFVESQGVELRESAPEADPYRVLACSSSSGKSGSLMSDCAVKSIQFTAPPRFGGAEGRWTPEDLLLGAIASCYTTTFGALAEYSQLKYFDLAVEVRGTLRKVERRYCFGEVAIRPRLMLVDGKEEQRALRLLQKAAATCMVSRLLSAEPAFEPQVQILESQGAAEGAGNIHSRGAV